MGFDGGSRLTWPSLPWGWYELDRLQLRLTRWMRTSRPAGAMRVAKSALVETENRTPRHSVITFGNLDQCDPDAFIHNENGTNLPTTDPKNLPSHMSNRMSEKRSFALPGVNVISLNLMTCLWSE